MKFSINSLGKYDYLEHEKAKLEKLGFVFEKSDKFRHGAGFWYSKINDPPFYNYEINSLEDLINFTNEYGDCIFDGFNRILTINDPDRS